MLADPIYTNAEAHAEQVLISFPAVARRPRRNEIPLDLIMCGLPPSAHIQPLLMSPVFLQNKRVDRNHNNGLSTVSSNHHVLTPVPGDPSGRLVMTLLPTQGTGQHHHHHELMHHHHPHHANSLQLEQHHSGASHSSGSTRYQGT